VSENLLPLPDQVPSPINEEIQKILGKMCGAQQQPLIPQKELSNTSQLKQIFEAFGGLNRKAAESFKDA
jgi:hypothetical protein